MLLHCLVSLTALFISSSFKFYIPYGGKYFSQQPSTTHLISNPNRVKSGGTTDVIAIK
jgi:hypothetical protein